MKGTGSGRGRLTATVIGRLLVSVTAALLVVAVASRVNRGPARARVLDEWPTAADRMLAEVEVDASRSLAEGVELINRAAPGGVRVEWVNLQPEDWHARGWPEAGEALRLRDVRLGTAVALWARMRGEDGLEWRLEKDAIVIGGPGTATEDLVGRLYDVGDIATDVEVWLARLGPLAESQPGGGGLFSGGGGSAPAPTLSQVKGGPVYWDAADELALLICQTIHPADWSRAGGLWVAWGWHRWIYVRAPLETHRMVERLLMIVRRGDSGPARVKGAGP